MFLGILGNPRVPAKNPWAGSSRPKPAVGCPWAGKEIENPTQTRVWRGLVKHVQVTWYAFFMQLLRLNTFQNRLESALTRLH